MEDQDQSGNELAMDAEGSDIFDTDSSGEDESPINGDAGQENLQITKLESDVPGEANKAKEGKEEIKEEMGGELVYDSYCRLKGNDKIEAYFNENPPLRVQTDILFSKTEMKEVSKDIFAEKARERDFVCDQDKHFFRNLPKF